MDKRRLDKLQIEVPLLGFGCMRFPLTATGSIDYPKSKEMIDYAFHHGVNYFDTSTVYHGGESETFLAKALADFPRESYYLTDKMPIWLIRDAAHMQAYFHQQLKACNTPYFDFYLYHSLNASRIPKMEQFGYLDFMKQMRKEGKVKYIGFSFHDEPEVLAQAVELFDWDFVQIQLNYFDWEQLRAKELYEILERKGIPCIVMEPVRGGSLADLPPSITKPFTDYDPKASTASWAIRWVASLPNVKCVLSGMSTMEQLKDNLALTSDFHPLCEREYTAIQQVLVSLHAAKTVPCTGCKYCTPCPFGVNIPTVFNYYSQYKIFRQIPQLRMDYHNLLGLKNGADQCTACGACKIKCPQKIDIPLRLSEVHEEIMEIIKA